MNIIDKRGHNKELTKEANKVVVALQKAGFYVKIWRCGCSVYGDLYIPTKFLYFFTYNKYIGDVFLSSTVWIKLTKCHEETIEKFKKIPELQNIDIHLSDK